MRVIPKTPRQMIEFFRRHVPVWELDPAGVGLTPQAILELRQLLDLAEVRLAEADQARSGAKSATQSLYGVAATLLTKGSNAVAVIKAAARGNTDVYSTAQLPVPSKPRREGDAPAQPANLAASIDSSGNVTLTWEGRGPTGTANGPGARGGAGLVFQVYRHAPGEGGYRLIGVTNKLTFVDAAPTLLGPSVYVVEARRGNQISPRSSTICVDLGIPRPVPLTGNTTFTLGPIAPDFRERAA
jgi:hypothetical protein